MERFKNILLVFLVGLACVSCNNNSSKKENNNLVIYQCPMKCEIDKTYNLAGSCPICKMDLKSITKQSEKIIDSNKISEESIFNLTSTWNTEESKTILLEDLKGETLSMSQQ